MTDNLPKWMLQKSLRGSDSFRPIKIYQDFSGIWYRWYKTGELYSTRHIKMGIDNGRVSGFHENGKKGFEGEYVNGKVNGMFISWDESGLMLYKEVFDFGIKVSSETWPPEAPGFSQKEYFERNGAVSKTEFLMNGKVTRTTQGSVIEDLLKSLEP
ncbi:MAG: hypothetical protein COA79_17640 [Planctomycetota bacterium]|nr:MAG: hypothetical protein COA79_17640 [Planctomycetota bacterium]